MRADADLIQRISRSEIYSEYEKAFGDSTELPLTLRTTEFWNLAHRNRRYGNPFCAMMAPTNRTCAACLEVQQQATDAAKNDPATVSCFAGLCDTTVPIKLGERTVGFLQTGRVALKKPSNTQFKEIAQKIVDWGSPIDLKQTGWPCNGALRLSWRSGWALSLRCYTSFLSHPLSTAPWEVFQSGRLRDGKRKQRKDWLSN